MNIKNQILLVLPLLFLANYGMAADGIAKKSYDVVANLHNKGYELPVLPESKAIIKQVVVSKNYAYVSGQLPLGFGELTRHVGQVGEDFTVEEGKKIAEISALNVIAQLQKAIPDLSKVKKCVKLTVFVNSTSSFSEQHLVANGASEVILAAFGEKGGHARSAIGVAQLPFGVAVEVEAIFEI